MVCEKLTAARGASVALAVSALAVSALGVGALGGGGRGGSPGNENCNG